MLAKERRQRDMETHEGQGHKEGVSTAAKEAPEVCKGM